MLGVECRSCFCHKSFCKYCAVFIKHYASEKQKSGHDWINNGLVADEYKPEKKAKRAYRFFTKGLTE